MITIQFVVIHGVGWEPMERPGRGKPNARVGNPRGQRIRHGFTGRGSRHGGKTNIGTRPRSNPGGNSRREPERPGGRKRTSGQGTQNSSSIQSSRIEPNGQSATKEIKETTRRERKGKEFGGKIGDCQGGSVGCTARERDRVHTRPPGGPCGGEQGSRVNCQRSQEFQETV